MSRQSLTKAQAKKDPMKQIIRSDFPMEEEKGNRVYGAMDGDIRHNMFRQVRQRWLESQNVFLSIIPFPDIAAADLCVKLCSGAHGVAVRQHCEDLRRSLRDEPVSAGLMPKASARLSPCCLIGRHRRVRPVLTTLR
jgi:hypothetical protein